MRQTTGRVPKLKRGQPVAMKRDVRVSRTRVERLANHKTCFAMLIAVRADPAHVRREREIARHLFRDEMKCVVGGPHVRAAARDEIFALCEIKTGRAGLGDAADVRLTEKNSELGRLGENQ